MRGRLRRELGLVPVAAVIFFNVSGGPYGIEDVVPSFGPGLALILLALTPLVWSLPVALVMSELASAIPDEGGYVTWVRRAFGPFWGFQVGWWSWVDSFVDVAIYPALFVEYLRFGIRMTPGSGLIALASSRCSRSSTCSACARSAAPRWRWRVGALPSPRSPSPACSPSAGPVELSRQGQSLGAGLGLGSRS